MDLLTGKPMPPTIEITIAALGEITAHL